jgi:hypothetical protein
VGEGRASGSELEPRNGLTVNELSAHLHMFFSNSTCDFVFNSYAKLPDPQHDLNLISDLSMMPIYSRGIFLDATTAAADL